MQIPNSALAVIEETKIVNYLLNLEHKRGRSKAQVLLSFGYSSEEWRELADDLRDFHLTLPYDSKRVTAYGTRYEIRAPLQTPDGRSLIVRTIWQIDIGLEVPQLLTLFPD